MRDEARLQVSHVGFGPLCVVVCALTGAVMFRTVFDIHMFGGCMSTLTRRIMLVIGALSVVTAGCAESSTSSGMTVADTVEVDVSGFAFRDPDVTVQQGGTVTWTNNDAPPHPLLFADGERYALPGGETVTLTFDDVGEFAYRCAVHQGMTGTVRVVAAGTTISDANRPNVSSGY